MPDRAVQRVLHWLLDGGDNHGNEVWLIMERQAQFGRIRNTRGVYASMEAKRHRISALLPTQFLRTVIVLLAIATASSARASATSTLLNNRLSGDSRVIPGYWHANLDKCIAYARNNGVPLIAVWSKPEGCSHCEIFADACNNTKFKDWMKASGCVFCFVSSADQGGQLEGDAFWFCEGGAGLSLFPFVRVYWCVNGETMADISRSGRDVDGNNKGANGANRAISWFKKQIKGYTQMNIDNGRLVSFWGELTDAAIPPSVGIIGESAFAGMSSLASVDIPGSVTNIEANAFAECSGLKSVSFRGDMPVIADSAFDGLAADCDVRVYSGAAGWGDTLAGVPVRRLPKVTVSFDANGGDDMSACRVSDFEGAEFSKSRIEYLPARAGYRFLGWFYGEADDAEPFTTTRIYKDTTLFAHWIKQVTIAFDVNGGVSDDAVTITIDQGETIDCVPYVEKERCTFLGWYAETENGEIRLNSEIIPDADMVFRARWVETGVWHVSIDDDGGIAVTGVDASDCEHLEVPAEIGEMPVRGICCWAFEGCRMLTTMTIPASVSYLEGGSFCGCPRLESVLFLGDEPEVHEITVGGGYWDWDDEEGDIWVDEGDEEILQPFPEEPSDWSPEAGIHGYESRRVKAYVRRGASWDSQVPGDWHGALLVWAVEPVAEGASTKIVDDRFVVTADGDGVLSDGSIKIFAVMEDGREVDATAGYHVEFAADRRTAEVKLAKPAAGLASASAAIVQNGGADIPVTDEDDRTGALVTVAEELIIAKPEADAGEQIAALPVVTHPGLFYQASWGSDLDMMTHGEKVQASGGVLYFGVIKQAGDKGFYGVRVSDR